MTDNHLLYTGRLLNLHITLPKAVTFGTQDIATLLENKNKKTYSKRRKRVACKGLD